MNAPYRPVLSQHEKKNTFFFVKICDVSTLRLITTTKCFSVDLGGLVVSVLATGPKFRGFDPDRGRWIFKGDKNP
jgi:hypothetical protein